MMKHTKHLLVLWAALLLGAGNAWGYTVTFNTATTDGGSTSTNVSDYVDNTSQTYIASITTSKAYYNGKSGVKLGSSSAVGNIVLRLSATGQIKASEISIVSTAFDRNKTYKCTVTYTDNNTVSQTQTAGNALTISLDPAKTVSSVKFESVTKSKGRCYIGSFTITPAGSTGTTLYFVLSFLLLDQKKRNKEKSRLWRLRCQKFVVSVSAKSNSLRSDSDLAFRHAQLDF